MKTIEDMHKSYMDLTKEYRRTGCIEEYERCMDICFTIREYASACGIDWRSWDHVVYVENKIT